MVDWITVIVVSLVVLFFLAVMYRALREPIDLVIDWIRNALYYASEKSQSAKYKAQEIIYYD